MRIDTLLFLLLSLTSCSKVKHYRAELRIDDTFVIPFGLEELDGRYTVVNGKDRIGQNMLHVQADGDSIVVRHHAFQSELRFTERNDSLFGYWLDQSRDRPYRMPFVAIPLAARFPVTAPPHKLAAKWDVTFDAANSKEKAIGVFAQQGAYVEGTFLTPTGDYRFFEGVMDGDQLRLSTFDFAHAYLLEAVLNEDSLVGTFFSGYHHRERWLAERNPDIALADLDANNLSPNGSSHFSYLDLNGKPVGPDDPLFANKAIVVQLFGSWCPNCYDESRVLQLLHAEFDSSALVFVGVGFERPTDTARALAHIRRFRDGLGITYPLGYGGVSSKDSANTLFPGLRSVWAFPTLLFYDQQHRLVGTHSGFNGPGTGDRHVQEVAELRERIKALIPPR